MYANGVSVERDFSKAVKYLGMAAEEGNVDAQFSLGALYHDEGSANKSSNKTKSGGTLPQTEFKKEAKKYLTLAADQGHKEAKYLLALIYESEKGKNSKKGMKSEVAALEMLESAAQQGHKGAILTLAFKYLEGEDVARDEKKAALLFKLAGKGDESQRETLDALYNLALLHFQGRGVPQDAKEAIKLLKKCTEKGHLQSTYTLARYLLEEEEEIKKTEGEELLRKAAAEGHLDAIHTVAIMQYSKEIAGEVDLESLKRATEAGHSDSAYLLSIIYFHEAAQEEKLGKPDTTENVEKKREAAIEYLRSAAMLGHPAALCRLALMHKDGIYLTKDRKEAERLLKMAGEQGHAQAFFILSEMVRTGDEETPGEETRAIKLLLKAATLGHVEAKYKLGVFCYNQYKALGDPRMISDAVRLFEDAEKAGHRGAKVQLAMLYYTGTGVEEDKERAKELWAETISELNTQEELLKE